MPKQSHDDGTPSELEKSYHCTNCPKKFSSAKSLGNHSRDYHPSKVRVRVIAEDGRINLQDVKSIDDIDEHSEEDMKSAEILHRVRVELDQSTLNRILTNCMLEALPSFTITHKSGAMTTALLTHAAAKRASTGPIIKLERNKKPKAQATSKLEDINSKLESSRYGKLIDCSSYQLLEPSFFVQNYKQAKEDIARNLAGALVYSGSQIILILKVEIYGRDPEEDPHSFNFVKPTLDVKSVATIEHDNCKKLVIGTLFWSTLVTSSIEVMTGTINVGAHSKSTETALRSIILGHKDWKLNPLAERQLRSKFHRKETFHFSASTFFPFSYWDCVPITIFNLKRHFSRKSSMTGTKAAAALFKKIFESKKKIIKKKWLEELLHDDKINGAEKIQDIIAAIVRLIP
ncbi:hypothetical protein BX616_007099 [Lobosporangium transversale]|uniref:C2H2-type domain-containing protein n=1 Tax=Lobosporangium transversale TaxID=64571 RepID=A0A1Y2GFQ7_9FUNG|nr:hypothetical protein BCR41DRAFT_399319 [Lobosporangium transversale]KAF9896617.1 hypothetical protein BX616_007099 [Lobosporangium transversale]ORZ08256.1 hypothetical protein BCR41DRAFT_399319 [Lobosporangium transversale]|eukprot:XP_021878339.1 hypothetical protein BCR41DRAFT_399319 [Lobosporangium transversale]